MFLYEFQAKGLLAGRGIPIPEGHVASHPDEAAAIAQGIGKAVAVKAQILGGGRGKAGGIRFAANACEAREVAQALLGSEIKGLVVEMVLVEERLAISEELYVGIISDASRRCPLVLYSPFGGVDIEEVVQGSPKSIRLEPVDILCGFHYQDAVDLLAESPLPEKALSAVAEVMERIYGLYRALDAELVEINPLVLVDSGELVAVDCKLVIDDNGLKRQESLPKHLAPGTPLELEAHKAGLTYVELDGDVAILANGAGLTMTTMDLVSHFGGRPANFMEIGGAAYRKAREALSIVLAHPSVKSLFINVFGAFARADVIADGVTAALQELEPGIPVVVCIRGTEEEKAREMVRSRLGIEPYTEMEEAAQAVVALAKGNVLASGKGEGLVGRP